MAEVLLTLIPETPHPNAGTLFQVVARLEQPATEDLSITFEKHRVFIDRSGVHELCVITDGYFTDDGFPKPIDLKRGDIEGTASVKVSEQAVNPQCPVIQPRQDVPVDFPDRLMLTAFVTAEEGLVGREHVVLTIKGQ